METTERRLFKHLYTSQYISKEEFDRLISQQGHNEPGNSESSIDDSAFNGLTEALEEDYDKLSEELLPPEVQNEINNESNKIGRYVKVKELGKGFNGVVYKAYDTDLKRFVALKFLNSEQNKEFESEAHRVAGLRHPNIVPVYDVGTHEGKQFISMAYIEGTTLDKVAGRLSAMDCVRIFRHVCDAIEYAHKNRIIHKDIKPNNIIIDENQWPYVMDFGIAHDADLESEDRGQLTGTPEYMAPELIERGDINTGCDIFAVGATIYHVLTGSAPFKGESVRDIIVNVVETDPPAPSRLNSSVKPAINLVVMKCLNKDPDKRYGSITGLRSDLDAVLQDRSLSDETSLPRIVKSPFLLIAVVFIILSGAAAFWISYGSKESANGVNPHIKATSSYERGMDLVRKITSTASLSGSGRILHMRSAITRFTEAIKADSSFAESYLQRGVMFFWQGKYDEAIADFTEAIVLNPGLANAYYYRIFCNFLKGMRFVSLMTDTGASGADYESSEVITPLIKGAKEDLERLEKMDTSPARLNCVKGVVEAMNGNNKIAFSFLDMAINSDKSMPEAYMARAVYYYYLARSLRDPEKMNITVERGTEDINLSLKLNLNMLEGYLIKSDLHLVRGEYEESLMVLNKLRKTDPGNPFYRLEEAKVRYLKGEVELADSILASTGNIILPDNESAFYYLKKGLLMIAMKRYEPSEKDFGKAIEKADEKTRGFIESVAETARVNGVRYR